MAIATLGALDEESTNAYLKQLAAAPIAADTRARAIAALCRHELDDAAELAAKLFTEEARFRFMLMSQTDR